MRKDAKKVKISSLNQLLIDLKPYRCDSDVYINRKLDVTNLVKYMDEKKKKNKDITYFHAFSAAIAMTIYNRKKLNYFVANRHVYEHNNIVLSFACKAALDDKSAELMALIDVDENDNIDTISEKLINKVSSFRDKKIKKEGANSAIDILAKLPNIIRVPFVALFKFLDKFGLLPSAFSKDNIYYSSMIISNLGSIKCNSIYHNLTNLGTCSGLITMGEIVDEEVMINGKKELRKICDFGITLDERVADGYYFVKSVKYLEYILNNPKLMDDKLLKKIEIK